ncbi:MAG TPA: FAD-dependent oxidoreductase [Burkholderiaceae bacterium]|nr:FAD-dependent oxidoreductase [Burkholderiaceae bacterium]
MLKLGFDLSFADLYERDGLQKVDSAFLSELAAADAGLHAKLGAARSNPAALDSRQHSQLLIDLAPHVEDFIGALFGIAPQIRALAARHHELAPLYEVKRQFIQRSAAKAYTEATARSIAGEPVGAELAERIGVDPTGAGAAFELAFARKVQKWQGDEPGHAADLDLALKYAAWALYTEPGRRRHGKGLLFKVPARIDPLHLLEHAVDRHDAAITTFTIKPEQIRRRAGFALTDPGTDLAGALDQANYCIWCHKQGKDSCSTGLKEKPASDGSVAFKKSQLGVKLAGCPLEEKISEFHTVKVSGLAIGALAIITVDNPLVAATGHRICNDCMKSCIYQKQEPVNIPQAETRTLKDVLELPWGFEIYSLLTRWNPLNIRRPLPAPRSGYRVLVAGMGPAGFALAHNLLNDGHAVVGIDGLKIEPLPPHVSGVGPGGECTRFEPIERYGDLHESLDERTMAGFGGVAEYGITVRWDKNFLKVVRLLLERRALFALFGGVRFGGTVTLEDAWALGFDHVALAMGAGKPTTLDIPHGLARGVRTASDFLMALQLTGAAKRESIANLQVRLPILVIGGGLTAIDTATEALAYYAVQVEKFLVRAEVLGVADFLAGLTREERRIADEFITHAGALRAERAAAAAEQRPARVTELLRAWGGSTIVYRKRLIDSPAYTLNHEEVELALQEGIAFAECLNPGAVRVDAFGAAQALALRKQVRADDGSWHDGEEVELPARAIFIAAGTSPNTVLAREDTAHFKLDGRYFTAVDASGQSVKPEPASSKPKATRVLVSKSNDGRFVSFFGDLHPSYFGNVVKALGSAKQGAPIVSDALRQKPPASGEPDATFLARLNSTLRPTVRAVRRLTPTIVEVEVEAPAAARAFQPGQFYRLQNYEAFSRRVDGTLPDTLLTMEGLALTGAATDKANGVLSTIVLEMGGSSDLCADLKPGEPVVLMGPTGTPTHIASNEAVMLVGGGLGNAVLFSIGAAFRARGSKVLYFAGYKKMIDRYKVEEIETASDAIVWCCDEGPGFTPGRPQDKRFVGNIVQAMLAYARGEIGATSIAMSAADRIIVIGSDRMMAAVAQARHTVLREHLKAGHCGVGSINSPMQCMMKEICAQCLQPHKMPDGTTRNVFSCFNQDQELDRVDWQALSERLGQNSVQEKLTAKWIATCRARPR